MVSLAMALGLSFTAAGGTARAADSSGETSGVAAPADVPTLPSDQNALKMVQIPEIPEGFAVRDLGWLRIAYPPSVEERVAPLIKDAEEIRAKLGDELGQTVLEHVQVRVTRSPEEMAALAPIGMPPPAYASGVAYPPLHLVELTMRAPDTSEAPDLDQVFRHELAHVALEDATLGHHVPRWFNEGLAVYESGEHPLLRVKTLGDAQLSGTIVPLANLDRGFPNEKYEVSIAYAESADFVRFLFRHADRERAIALTARVRQGESFDLALRDAYGVDARKLEFEWHEELERRFTIWPVVTGGSLVWVLTCIALGWAYVARRKKTKLTLARWEKEEAMAEARRVALAAIAAEAEKAAADAAAAATASNRDAASSAGANADAVPHPTSRPPMIEHDGSWHVLH